MSDRGWLGLVPTEDPRTWRLPVVPRVCGGTGWLHGGCALAAAVTTLEHVTARSLVWASAQYLSRIGPGDTLDIAVEPLVEGNRTTQARATCSSGGEVILTVAAACGLGRPIDAGCWGAPPAVPPPERCPPRDVSTQFEGCFNRSIDVRTASARPGERRSAFWVAFGDGVHGTTAGMAMLGDYVPTGLRATLGVEAIRGSSLDNTVRIVREVETEWLLVDVDTDVLAGGVAHGSLRFWTVDGQLAGSASQSFAVASIGEDG